MKYFKKIAEKKLKKKDKKNTQFAKGIPYPLEKKQIPEFSNESNKAEWEFAVQEHNAHRAGHHKDLRLGDPEAQRAYSWALRYWPERGEKRLAKRQVDHTLEYMDFEGQIPEGYGAGEVRLPMRGRAKIEKSSPDKITFVYNNTRYTIVRTGDDNWLLLNREEVRSAS